MSRNFGIPPQIRGKTELIWLPRLSMDDLPPPAPSSMAGGLSQIWRPKARLADMDKPRASRPLPWRIAAPVIVALSLAGWAAVAAVLVLAAGAAAVVLGLAWGWR